MVPNTTFAPPDSPSEPKPILAGQPVVNGQVHTILYYVDKNNPDGPDPTNPNADPQFHNWETGVQTWASQNASLLSGLQNTGSTQH
jgi:hypothetical protein